MSCKTSSAIRWTSADRFDPFAGKGRAGLSDVKREAVREVMVPNKEGLHARPVMRFVDLASNFQAEITVTNVSRSSETVDGKSAMQMMLLEATKGSVLRIAGRGEDAEQAVDALAALVAAGFDLQMRNSAC